ncbi:hypothetical protein GX48_02259 [Paracoccidioides brasiliensis]|nr:hypothetical protein GX48_02259 [Paracoccidioides brasiliensis]
MTRGVCSMQMTISSSIKQRDEQQLPTTFSNTLLKSTEESKSPPQARIPIEAPPIQGENRTQARRKPTDTVHISKLDTAQCRADSITS